MAGRQRAWRGMHGGGGGMHAWQGACVVGKTAIAVVGTHPTGMHSCLFFTFVVFLVT